ncbi:TonB-dependent receptor [Emcibacter nanhaiensis]|uniref:TonB-dependent receptor n=1 Tax=Emcibacter nanhaiensis TaxID=1505037 RepID=A0A501PJ77_9PROT|nr:TonB-dependent receptor [Emcibacter nanhaiensis]TPD60187.1 TonB-dependent receptor [Emcibacter nanhaiensis]
MRRKLLGTTAVLLIETVLGTSVHAQDASGDAVMFEEITVTATRRSQSVTEIPSNITAVSGDRLEKAGISDISGLVRAVPGLALFDEGPRTSGNRNNFVIRGLNANPANNNDDNPSLVQPSVSTYLGETPVFFPLKLVDLERVEVLRGPQGTLYGAGSVGGTIRFIPKKPDFEEFTVDVNLETSLTKSASDPSFDGYITVNAPVSDKAAVRFTGGYEYTSGFIDAVGLIQQEGTARNPGGPVLADPDDFVGSGAAFAEVEKDHNDARAAFFRGAALFEPSDNVEIQLNYAYQEVEADGRYEDNPNYGTGEDYVSYKAYTDPQDSRIHLINGDVQVDLGFARLTSATSYADVKTDSVSESSGFLRTNLASYYFGFPRLYSPIVRHQRTKTFTQEVRLVSNGDGMFDWTIGGYYMKRKLSFDLLQTMAGISDYTNAIFGLDADPLDFSDVLAEGRTDETFQDLAGFGELTLHATDRLDVTIGARVFHQKTEGEAGIPLPYASRTTSFFYAINPLDDYLLGGYNSYEQSSTDAIFKANVAYTIDDDTLVYATWAQGFRPGGANALPLIDPFGNDNSDIMEYESDTATNYEIGVKGRLADQFTYTVTLFQVDWDDFQTILYSPFGQNYVDNVPGARSRGVEAEVYANLSENLSLMLGYAYVDAETTADFYYTFGNPDTLVPTGTTLPGSSKHALTVSLDYLVPGEVLGGQFALHGDLSYRSKTATGFVDIENFVQDGYIELDDFTVLNASISWRKDDWDISLFGENLTNSRGTTQGLSAEQMGEMDQSRGVIRPLSVGLRLKLSL